MMGNEQEMGEMMKNNQINFASINYVHVSEVRFLKIYDVVSFSFQTLMKGKIIYSTLMTN